MTPIYLFDVMSQHNSWLSARQSLVAQNVANASTPGFKALDVKAFTETLDQTRLDMAQSQKAHFSLGAEAIIEPEIDAEAAGETSHSGNNVALERQFAKSGEIARSFALNTGVMKSFHRMLLLSTKG